jgi:hypothetical protein
MPLQKVVNKIRIVGLEAKAKILKILPNNNFILQKFHRRHFSQYRKNSLKIIFLPHSDYNMRWHLS